MIYTEITATGSHPDGTAHLPSPAPVVNLIPPTPEKPSIFVEGSSSSPMQSAASDQLPVDAMNVDTGEEDTLHPPVGAMNIDTGGEDTLNPPPTTLPALIPQAEEDPVKSVIATSSLALPTQLPARSKSKSKSRSPSPNVHLDVPILECPPLR